MPLGNNKHFNTVTQTNGIHIIKARLFCKYLKGSSLHIIYAYHQQHQHITYIEIYHKSNKQNENKQRIKSYLKNHQE